MVVLTLSAQLVSAAVILLEASPRTSSEAGTRSSQGNEQSSGVPATDQPENVATATLQPASQTTTTPAPELVLAVAPKRTEKFVILVKPHKLAWVSITADGKPFNNEGAFV